MNNISNNRFVNQTIDFFNDRLVQALTPLQKKIAVVVLTTFTLIAAWFVYARHCGKKSIENGKPEDADNAAPIIPIVPVDWKDNQKKAVDTMGAQMKDAVKEYNIHQWLEEQKQANFFFRCSGVCFVKMDFDKESIRQQFIFKNKYGDSFTEEDCLKNIDNAMKSVEGALKNELGAFKGFTWYILLKGDSKDAEWIYFLRQGDNTGYSAICQLSRNTNQTLEEACAISTNFMGDVGVPKDSVFVKDQDFLEGEFYKEINP